MRAISRVFLPFFMVWMLVAPVKSYAFLPLAVPLISALTAGGSLTALDTLGIGVAVTGIAYLLANAPNPVQVNLNAQTPLPVPVGWTPAVPPAVQPVPPPSIPAPAAGTLYYVYGYTPNVSLSALCAQITLALSGGSTFYHQSSCQVGTGGYTMSNSSGVVVNRGDITSGPAPVTCPAGYVVSGGNTTCMISVPTAVIKPPTGTCHIIRVGNTFTVDNQSADCAKSPTGVGYSVNGNTVGLSAPDGRRASVSINADGSSTITDTLPSAAGVTPSTTTTTTVGLGVPDVSTGTTAVGGVGQTTTMGTGSQNQPTVASAPPIQMPTDYNREATQQAIEADLAVTASTSIPDSEVTDIQILTGDSGLIPKFDRTGLTGSVNLPSSDGTCTPLVLDFQGLSWKWDYCALVTYLHPLIDFFFTALFGVLCFQTLFKRKEI